MADQGQDMDGAQIEEALNKAFGGIWRTWTSGKAPFKQAAARFTEGRDGRLVMSGLLVLDDAITSDRLKSVPVRALENSFNLTKSVDAREAIRELPKLERAEHSPEEFAQLVAEHYRAWAAIVPHPVAAMAADAGVKPPTVHSWVREARLRGFLPPAKRGKA
jgi:transposase-like protein